MPQLNWWLTIREIFYFTSFSPSVKVLNINVDRNKNWPFNKDWGKNKSHCWSSSQSNVNVSLHYPIARETWHMIPVKWSNKRREVSRKGKKTRQKKSTTKPQMLSGMFSIVECNELASENTSNNLTLTRAAALGCSIHPAHNLNANRSVLSREKKSRGKQLNCYITKSQVV